MNIRKALPVGLALFVAVAVALMIPRYSYNDPDTFWHIELGRYMIDHGTILHHAIHTFYQDQLPYVPHEYAFQIVLAALYDAFGWPGAYLLTAASLGLLILGMIRLTQVSRKEIGVESRNPLLLLIVLLAACWVYYNYFTTRPQMISAWMIVWFVVYLREYQLNPRLKYAAILTALSLAIANFHAGVWLVVAVFTGMALLELWGEKRLTLRRAWVYLPVWLAGLLNPGSWKSILFILTVTKDNANMLIDEWQPIPFSKLTHLPMMLLLLFFAASLPLVLHRKPFRYMLMLGILYLGVSSFKMNLFMWLLIPYFAATLPEQVPLLRRLNEWLGDRLTASRQARAVASGLMLGLALNIAIIFAFPPQADAKLYPVDEMDYIMQQQSETSIRPRVMAPYGASGYVMYRGGDVLCDGRQDPFITDASKGALGWNAFQRSMWGYGEYLPEVVAGDRPDYVIVHSHISSKLVHEWETIFGKPVFEGQFGRVFAISPDLALFK